MKFKLFLFISLLSFIKTFSQSDEHKNETMGFYISPSVQVGFNLGNKIKSNQHKDSDNYQHNVAPYLPNDFTYGVSVVGGYQVFRFMAIGTGFRYNYITDNFHLLNWAIQPKFFFGKDDGKVVLELEYGKQINQSIVSNTNYFGGKLAWQDSLSKGLNQELGVFLYGGNYTLSNTYFVGLSFGITIFSQKNYTVYGND